VCLALGPSGILWRGVTLGGRGLRKGFNTLDIQFSLKISEEMKKEGKKSKLRRFCNAFMTFS